MHVEQITTLEIQAWSRPHANDTRRNVQMRHAGGWTRSEGGMLDGEEGWRGMRNKQHRMIILERLK